jgi:ubiquinone biosynthesis UbiH/UbiF/VisC/COQ6 family hydroxylase
MAVGEELFDVVIVGGASVGLSFALALHDSGLRVALCNRTVLCVEPPNETWDARVYAISPGSAAFLHELGVWQGMDSERIAPIETMRVFGDERGAKIDFSAYELGERALAWIVENRALQNALVDAVHCLASGERFCLLAPAQPRALHLERNHAVLTLDDGTALRARLIVGADGAQSWTRAAAGIAATPRRYGQSGVVANFAVERAHHGRASQWFLGEDGVLAWLPLPGKRVSIVWSAPDTKAGTLMQLSKQELAQVVAEAGGQALGRMECITPAAAFPLQFLRLSSPVSERVALIGDAAHCVHPLAGQGLNLGFADAHALAAILRSHGPVHDCGAGLLLERFVRRRAEAVLAMQTVTDGLSRLFGARDPVSRWVRNRGLAAVDRLGVLKRLLAQPALR